MSSTTHDLKIDPKHYLDVFDGKKRAECRYNDRNYKVGDFIRLRPWDNRNGYLDVAPLLCYVTHVLLHFDGLKPGYCLLSIVPLNNHFQSVDYSKFQP